MESTQKVDYLNRKGRLPYGWTARVSKTYPDRVYYYNTISRDTTWECPALTFKEGGDKSSSSQHSNREADERRPGENRNLQPKSRRVQAVKKDCPESRNNMGKKDADRHCSSQRKSPDRQHWVKVTDSKKRKSEEIVVNSLPQKRLQIKPFKIASVKTPIRPPSPKNSSRKLAVDIQEKPDPSKSVISKNEFRSLSPRTAVVDPIVRKSSPEPNRRPSVYSRLSPRMEADEGMWKIKKAKKKALKAKKKAASKQPNNEADDFPKKFALHARMPCSASSREQEGAVQYRNQHGVVDNIPSNKVAKSVNPVSIQNEEKSHEAVNVTEDVEMLDISQRSPTIEESMLPPEPMDEYFGNEETMLTHIVIDTNIWLCHWKGIDELKDTQFDSCGPPVVYIPWVVVQELDKLKQRRNTRAIECVRYIYDVLQSRHPRVRGQNSKMAIKDSSYLAECNDDKILQCCEQLCHVLPKEKILLLTNDKNLVTKALLNDMIAHTWDSLQHHISKIPGVSSTASLVEKVPETESAMKIFLDDISCRIKSMLKPLLEGNLIPEFQKVFKDYNWEKVLTIKAPYSLTDLLFCVKKHWISCYSYMFSQNMKRDCTELFELLKRTKGFICTKEDISIMLTCAEKICIEMKGKKLYRAEPTLTEIKKLRLVCELHFQKSSSITNQKTTPFPKPAPSTTASGANASLSVFQYIWSVISNFTTMILNCCDNPSSSVPHHSDIAAFLPRFYQNVHELWTCMQHVLTDASRNDRVGELHKCLVNFVPLLKTDTPPPNTEDFTVGSLAEFCRDADRRGLLEIGFQQLKDFYTSLDRCIAKNGTLIVKGVNSVT